MFGYIICNRKGLEQEELERYRGVYCGVCRALQKQFGQLERFSLSYDMTFLAIFLSALYEPEETRTEFRCGAHPFQKRTAIENKYTSYAADITVALAYYKCRDDWEDERKHLSKGYGKILEKGYREVRQKYPRQCRRIAESIKELSEIEKSAGSLPDEAINCSGKMLSEIFVYEEDFWSGILRSFGYELGRFVYLMDAAVDYKEDIKKGNYNPLVKMNKKPDEVKDILMMEIGNAAGQFEKLPILQDDHLIRNILYGGVWQKYYASGCGKEKKNG